MRINSESLSYCLVQDAQPYKGAKGNAIVMGSSPLGVYTLRHESGEKLGFAAQINGRIYGSCLRIGVGLKGHQVSVVARNDQHKPAGLI